MEQGTDVSHGPPARPARRGLLLLLSSLGALAGLDAWLTVSASGSAVWLGLAGLLWLMLLSALALLVTAWFATERVLRPRSAGAVPLVPTHRDLPFKEVVFPSGDGTLFRGWFLGGSKRAAIVLVHGFGATRQQMLPHTRLLHQAGFPVLLFDLRGAGESQGSRVTLGYREQEDIIGAVRCLQRQPGVESDRVGVLGVSLGAVAAILAAARCPDIRALVVESAFRSISASAAEGYRRYVNLPPGPFSLAVRFIVEQRLGVSIHAIAPERVVGRIAPRAVLIIHGLNDRVLGASHAEALYLAAKEPKELWLVPGAAHANACSAAPETYRERVVRFFEAYLS